MRTKSFKNITGFTLIELLVVISIIGVLASIVLASLNSARVKARDARRIADLNQIRTALNFYYDANNAYPPNNQWVYSTAGSAWITGISPTYIATVPVDPLNIGTGPWNGGTNYDYAYGANNGQIYDLVGLLEDQNNPQRCAAKLWRYHQNSELPWCTATTDVPYSRWLYADH